MRNKDIQLIDIAINELVAVYNLSPSFGDILKDNIIKRSNLYGTNQVPQTNETRVIKNIDSIPLFFLNRLLNNIRTYIIDSKMDSSRIKGNYISAYQTLEIVNKSSLTSAVGGVLKNKLGKVDKDVVLKATEKVLNHEVGHALQTSFSGAIGTNDLAFKRLIDSLNHKYPKYFYSYNDLGTNPLTKEKNGMKVKKRNDNFKSARDYYAPNAYLTHIDEIFNEDEALVVSGITTPQMDYTLGGIYDKKVYNYDSSNYRITSYGRMMKILLGEKKTFKAMYEDPIILYVEIDEFQEEAKRTFSKEETRNLTPMMEVLCRLDTVRSSNIGKNVIEEANELDLFFTRCLKRKVEVALNSSTLTDIGVDRLISFVSEFKNCLMTSKTEELETHKICDELIKRLIARKRNSNTRRSDNELAYDAYLDIADRICEAIDLQDDISYSRLYAMLIESEKRIKKVPMEALKKDFSTMTFDEKMQFFLFNMKKAIVKKVPDAYRYYRSNLEKLKTGKYIDQEVTPKF